jgi:hypothetical protein
MYVDRQDRIVLGAGNNHLVRIVDQRDSSGRWKIRIASNWDLSETVTSHCGSSSNCDYLESVTPDWSGGIWFSTAGGVVGTVDPNTGALPSTTLADGERVANSISSSPAGVAVASD